MRVSAEAVIEHGTLRRAQLRCDEELRAQHRRMTDAVYAAAAIPVRTSEPMRRDPTNLRSQRKEDCRYTNTRANNDRAGLTQGVRHQWLSRRPPSPPGTC
jgi:hypothetical protein